MINFTSLEGLIYKLFIIFVMCGVISELNAISESLKQIAAAQCCKAE